MDDDIKNFVSKGNWTIETWAHDVQRPLPSIMIGSGTAELKPGQWNHVAVTRNNGTANTYINGEKVKDDYTIECETKQYWNKDYYVVKPRGMLGNRDFDWQDMLEWCLYTFGPSEGVWTSNERWYCNNARFYFKYEKDRDWFLMRFS